MDGNETYERAPQTVNSDNINMFDHAYNCGSKLFTQLNELIRDLHLPKDSAELLGSRLEEKD